MKTNPDFESYTAEDLLQYCLDYIQQGGYVVPTDKLQLLEMQDAVIDPELHTFWLTQVATWINDHSDNPSFEPLQYLNDRIKEKVHDLRFIEEYNDWYRAYVEDELQEKVDNCKYDL